MNVYKVQSRRLEKKQHSIQIKAALQWIKEHFAASMLVVPVLRGGEEEKLISTLTGLNKQWTFGLTSEIHLRMFSVYSQV